MKNAIWGFVLGIVAILSVQATQASFSEELECERGSSSILSDLDSILNNINRRVVACHNVMVGYANELNADLRKLDNRVHELELQMIRLSPE